MKTPPELISEGWQLLYSGLDDHQNILNLIKKPPGPETNLFLKFLGIKSFLPLE